MKDLPPRVFPALVRLLLLVPLAGGIALLVAAMRTNSTGLFVGGIVVSGIGFMIAGIKISVTESTEGQQYDHPARQCNFSAASPDGKLDARIAKTYEVGAGQPPVGELRLSDGLVIESCAPYLVWSDDSRYLAVPQHTCSTGFFGRSFSWRLLVIDTGHRVIFGSKAFKTWPRPESFSGNHLVVGTNPGNRSVETAWSIPGDLAKFTGFTYERFTSPPTSVLRRIWPFVLGLCWCAGLFLWQLQALDHQEVLYDVPRFAFASWLMLTLPLLAIFWICVAYKPTPGKKGNLDRSREMAFGLAFGWIASMAIASGGAIRLGYDLDKNRGSVRSHDSMVLGKREYGGHWEGFLQRPRIHRYYVSTRLNGGVTDLPVDGHVYERLKTGDDISVIEVTGQSGRQYVTVGSSPR